MKDTDEEVLETQTEMRHRITIDVEESTYMAIHDLRNAEQRKMGRPVKISAFVEDTILKPHLEAAREAGILKD